MAKRNTSSGVISVFTRSAIQGEGLVVNGDGGQTRDFVFVGDVVEAVLLALKSPGARGEAINIGTGRSTSINTLAETLVSQTGSTSRIAHGSSRPGDIRHSVAKVDKAESLLGFKAGTPLQEGLATTIEWMRTELEGT